MIFKSRPTPQGYAVISGEYGEIREMDTYTCAHCQKIVMVPPKPADMPGGICGHCKRIICDGCVEQGTCRPFLKEIEEAEEQDFRRRTRGY